MKAITFTSFKGGAGKTTALMIACSALVARGKSVCLLEADENRPLTEWKKNALAHNAWSDKVDVFVADDMQRLETSYEQAENSGYDFILIDTHGGGSELNNTIVASSDFIVLPTALTQLDADETLKTYAYVAELLLAEDLNTGTAILRQRVPSGKLSVTQRGVSQILESLPSFSEPIYDRDAFASMKLRDILYQTLGNLESDKMNRIQANNYKRACREAENFGNDLIEAVGE